MQCQEFEQVLKDYDSASLPPEAVAHTAECPGCRALSSDLAAITRLAMDLRESDVEPPERVWISLRNQLEAEGLIRDVSAGPRHRLVRESHPWWSQFQRPALAGAFLAVAMIAAGLLSYQSNVTTTAVHPQLDVKHDSATRTAGTMFTAEALSAGSDDAADFYRLDPAVTSAIRRNLSVVDNLIAICEKSVREQPDNEIAREYLYGAYEQKAELLAAVSDRAASGGLQ